MRVPFSRFEPVPRAGLGAAGVVNAAGAPSGAADAAELDLRLIKQIGFAYDAAPPPPAARAAAAAPDARPRAGERFYLSIDYVKAYRAAEEPEVAGPSDAHVGDEAQAPSLLLLLPLRSCT